MLKPESEKKGYQFDIPSLLNTTNFIDKLTNGYIPSEKEFYAHADYFEWGIFHTLSGFIYEFSNKFYNDFKKEINWNALIHKNPPESFIDRFKANIDEDLWKGHMSRRSYSYEFLENNIELSLKYDLLEQTLQQNIAPREFLEKYKNSFSKKHWGLISFYQNLDVYFLESNKDLVDWEAYSHRIIIPIFIIEKFRDKIDWQVLTWYKNVPEYFFDKFKEEMLLSVKINNKINKNDSKTSLDRLKEGRMLKQYLGRTAPIEGEI